ncbi:MAG: hypothetical protein IT462_07950 [Planctomycetes bacterium]|nr:hypothetical protein [Planctomycetota bacterium]
MSDEIKFHEAAQLYARSIAIVDAMYGTYVEELHAFWERLFKQLRDLRPGWKLDGSVGKAKWFQFQPISERRTRNPYYWVDSWESSRVITHGEIRLYAALENVEPREKGALQALARKFNWNAGKGDQFDLFRVTLKVEGSMHALAEQIVDVSEKMQRAVE